MTENNKALCEDFAKWVKFNILAFKKVVVATLRSSLNKKESIVLFLLYFCPCDDFLSRFSDIFLFYALDIFYKKKERREHSINREDDRIQVC